MKVESPFLPLLKGEGAAGGLKHPSMRKVNFRDLGLIDYKECWDYQEKLFQEIISVKAQNRNLAADCQLPTANC